MSQQLPALGCPPRAWDRPLLSRAAPTARLAGVATVSIAHLLNRCPQCVVTPAAPARRPGPACGPCHRHHIPTPPPVCVCAPPHLTGTRRGPHLPLVARAPTAAPVPPLLPSCCVAHASHIFPDGWCVCAQVVSVRCSWHRADVSARWSPQAQLCTITTAHTAAAFPVAVSTGPATIVTPSPLSPPPLSPPPLPAFTM